MSLRGSTGRATERIVAAAGHDEERLKDSGCRARSARAHGWPDLLPGRVAHRWGRATSEGLVRFDPEVVEATGGSRTTATAMGTNLGRLRRLDPAGAPKARSAGIMTSTVFSSRARDASDLEVEPGQPQRRPSIGCRAVRTSE